MWTTYHIINNFRISGFVGSSVWNRAYALEVNNTSYGPKIISYLVIYEINRKMRTFTKMNLSTCTLGIRVILIIILQEEFLNHYVLYADAIQFSLPSSLTRFDKKGKFTLNYMYLFIFYMWYTLTKKWINYDQVYIYISYSVMLIPQKDGIKSETEK